MNFDWRDDDLRRAQREEEMLRSQMSDLDEALRRALPKAPPHPHLLHSREEWEELTKRPTLTYSQVAEVLAKWAAPTRPRIVPEGAERTAEEMIEDKAKEVTAHLLDAIERRAWQVPAPYTIDFPTAHLRMQTTADPDALLRIVQDVEIIDGPTAKPVEWSPGYCYAQGEGQ